MTALKHLLEGRPVRVPLHAAVVHFPLACFAIATLLDVGSWVLPGTDLDLVAAAYWAICAGVATSVLAAALGFVDYTSIREDHPGKKYATAHMVLNLISVGLFAVTLLVRRDDLSAARTPGTVLAMTLLAFGLLTVSGYIGGHMVYNDGIAVGRHRRRTPLPQRTMELPEPEDDFSPVCHVDEFTEGGTLRTMIRGTVIAIAKSEGQFYAFQEFCPHRFGPLSEGSIQNGQVVCPWHQSCFDLTTGHVCSGPAKVPIQTYPVEIRYGRIFVKVPTRHQRAER
jgi:nitrite reductase/ring-hydroxylating ferredoxin subunit/uncharacterized membrane protein